MHDLCQELLCHALSYLPTHSRLPLAIVSKSWAAAIADSRSIVLMGTPAAASAGLPKILCRFTRLQELSLRLVDNTDEMMHALVNMGSSYTGSSSLRHISSETSSIMLGLSRSPQLRSLVLKEGFAMPIPHVLSMRDNGLELLFVQLARTLHCLDIDCPLLWAVYRFSELSLCDKHPILTQIEEPSDDENDDATVSSEDLDAISDNDPENGTSISDLNLSQKNCNSTCLQKTALQSLSIRSLHSASFADFINGWMGRQKLESLKSLHLRGDEASLFARHLRTISSSASNLQSLMLSNCRIRTGDIAKFARTLPETIEELCISSCDIQVGAVISSKKNMAEEIVLCITNTLGNLHTLSISHCKLIYDESFLSHTSHAFINSGHFSTPSSMKGVPLKLKTLQLLGFGRQMPDIRFILKFPLETLQLDDISPSIMESMLPVSMDNMDRKRNDSTHFHHGVGANITWADICHCLPHLVHLDMRFTRASSTPQEETRNEASNEGHAESKLPPSSDRSVETRQVNILSKLRSLKLYAPSSISAVYEILRLHTSLEIIKFSYIPCTLPREALIHHINLPHLKSMSLHSHGSGAQATLQQLALSVSENSHNLTLIDLNATRSVYHVTEADPISSIHNNGRMSVRGYKQTPHITVAPPRTEISSTVLESLISSSESLKSLLLSGFTLSAAAIAWMTASPTRYSHTLPWHRTLETLSFAMAYGGIVLIPALLKSLPCLVQFELCIESIPTLIGNHCHDSDSMVKSSPRIASQLGMPSFGSSDTLVTSDVSSGSYGGSLYAEVHPEDRGAPLDSLDTQHTVNGQESGTSVDSESESDVSEIGVQDRSFAGHVGSSDEWREGLCRALSDELRLAAWWLKDCKVWTPSIKKQHARITFLRRILAVRRLLPDDDDSTQDGDNATQDGDNDTQDGDNDTQNGDNDTQNMTHDAEPTDY
ncbi:hypothetical protein BASA50_011348 [Batrachochytrium salamandrivorans]|uniref:F-box domain-containing protein n=1 Tax=Batrachochytrium salamandrivorans TaxID=1357716 RepID=A0ABQ8EYK2_9FUNG|nr:hypothetical protein BASA50_011348 [Batrachochytrium salamandrivorans]